jgi:hypothetical protein
LARNEKPQTSTGCLLIRVRKPKVPENLIYKHFYITESYIPTLRSRFSEYLCEPWEPQNTTQAHVHVKLPLYLIKHGTIKTYESVAVWLQALISVLDGCESLASLYRRRPRDPLNIWRGGTQSRWRDKTVTVRNKNCLVPFKWLVGWLVGWLEVLFHDAFSVTTLHSVDDTVICEWRWIARDLVGHSRDLILRHYHGHSLGWTEENHKKLKRDSRSPGPLEYEGLLITRRRSRWQTTPGMGKLRPVERLNAARGRSRKC